MDGFVKKTYRRYSQWETQVRREHPGCLVISSNPRVTATNYSHEVVGYWHEIKGEGWVLTSDLAMK